MTWLHFGTYNIFHVKCGKSSLTIIQNFLTSVQDFLIFVPCLRLNRPSLRRYLSLRSRQLGRTSVYTLFPIYSRFSHSPAPSFLPFTPLSCFRFSHSRSFISPIYSSQLFPVLSLSRSFISPIYSSQLFPVFSLSRPFIRPLYSPICPRSLPCPVYSLSPHVSPPPPRYWML